jgi:hypothetical protein
MSEIGIVCAPGPPCTTRRDPAKFADLMVKEWLSGGPQAGRLETAVNHENGAAMPMNGRSRPSALTLS